METPSTPSANPRLSRQSFFHLLGAAFTTLLFSGNTSGCSGNEASPAPSSDDVLTLDLTDVVNQPLTVKGGYIIAKNIVVAHTNSDQYVAVAGRCSHDNTILVFRAAEDQFYCPLDLSRYTLSGRVISGPATTPLKVYDISTPSAGVLVIR